MADNTPQAQVELLRAILREISDTKRILESLVRMNLRESKEHAREVKAQRKKMLLEAKKILETPNKEAMILEELKKRGYRA